MKFTCDREKLLHAFQMAAGVASSRSPKPILQNIKLELTEDTATLMATDLEVGIRIEVPGFAVEGAGSAVLPKDRFGRILRENSDEKLFVEGDGQGMTVRGEHSKFRLPVENPDEYPNVGAFEAEYYFELPARFFRELIRRTVFATDVESSRYALGGVLLEFSGDRVHGVGTDSRRLARQEGPVTAVGTPTDGETATIVPAAAMRLIERALADNDEEVQLAARDNDVLVKSQRTTIHTRLVEGRFPDWRRVFPTRENAVRIELVVGPFYAAVRQAAILTSEDRRGVEFTFGEGNVVLSGRAAEIGESRIDLPIAYDGTKIPITLDWRYLADFLNVLDPDQTFTLEIAGPESAAVCSTDDGYGYVVMPLTPDRESRKQ